MLRILFALCATVAIVAIGVGADTKKKEGGCFGTTIEFLDSPKEAAKAAKKDEKLVMLLHVSGNFEDPRFT